MNCPECKSDKVEFAGKPVENVGKVIYGKRCGKCGHFWSDGVAPKPAVAELSTPAPAAELRGVPPAAEPAAAPVVIAPAPAAPAKAGRRNGRKGQQQP